MQKFEASTLNEACKKAAQNLNCMINELEYNIIQYPTKGILGLFAKPAIIEVVKINRVEKTYKKEINNIEDDKTKEEDILNNFFTQKENKEYETISAKELENKLKSLFAKSCFDIDTVEVDIEENIAYIFIDGNDAALLIGKEGYRYNALSYIIFNWINAKYGLSLKLEIAQFLASQQDMIKNRLSNVVEHIKRTGWGKTKPLNGILVQIALEYLRDTFPDKYIAVKINKDKEKYIIINEFNKK